jgi:hypothetical protein
MWDKQLDLEGAMDFVDQLTRKRVQEYVDAKAQLRSFGPELDAKVALYVLGIEYWVQGAIDWTFMTPRECHCLSVNSTHTHDVRRLLWR